MLCLQIWPSSARSWHRLVTQSALCWTTTRCLGGMLHAVMEWHQLNVNPKGFDLVNDPWILILDWRVPVLIFLVFTPKNLVFQDPLKYTDYTVFFEEYKSYTEATLHSVNFLFDQIHLNHHEKTNRSIYIACIYVTTKVDEIPDGADVVDAAVANYQKSKPKMWWRCFGGCKCDVTCKHAMWASRAYDPCLPRPGNFCAIMHVA